MTHIVSQLKQIVCYEKIALKISLETLDLSFYSKSILIECADQSINVLQSICWTKVPFNGATGTFCFERRMTLLMGF